MAETEIERRVRMAALSGQLGTWERDLRTGELTVSEHCKSYFGRRSGEYLSLEDALASVHPEDRAKRAEAAQRCLQTGEPYSVRLRVMRPDGSLRVLELLGHVAKDTDGVPLRLVGSCIDISDHLD